VLDLSGICSHWNVRSEFRLCFSHGVVTGESHGRESVEDSKAAYLSPKGTTGDCTEGSCRPFRTSDDSLLLTTDLRPWLSHAVPLGLNRVPADTLPTT